MYSSDDMSPPPGQAMGTSGFSRRHQWPHGNQAAHDYIHYNHTQTHCPNSTYKDLGPDTGVYPPLTVTTTGADEVEAQERSK